MAYVGHIRWHMPVESLAAVVLPLWVNYLGMYPATYVDSAFYPLWDGKMSISLQAE